MNRTDFLEGYANEKKKDRMEYSVRGGNRQIGAGKGGGEESSMP